MLPQKSISRPECSIEMPYVCQDDVMNFKPKPFTDSTRCPSQSSSLSSNSGDICRICHCEGAPDLPLITPCYCSGSLRYVHQTCLQQWIKSSNIRNCELCKFQFIMQTKVKPFNEWEYLEMSGLERKKLLCAMLFHIIAMTCVCWSLYVLIDRTLDEVQKGHLEWPFWTKLIVVGIGFMGGIVFMYIQCKAYFILCKRWKAYNRVIYVQNAPEKPTMQTVRLHPGTSDKELPIPSCSFKHPERKRSSDNIPETSCIDIKGVRNLHIFFGEENQIRFHRNDRVSETRALTQAGEHYPVCEETHNGMKSDKNHLCGNTSLHIQIGNVDYNRIGERPCLSSNLANDNNTYGGALCPSDLKVNRLQEEKDRITGDQSVVKLQIKKAEIVIEFGENADPVKYPDVIKESSAQEARLGNIEIGNSPKRKFNSEEYLDCDKYFEKVANESNELPTSRLLINKVPFDNFKEKALLKDWKSSEDLTSANKVSDIKF